MTDKKKLPRLATQLVRGGINRSPHKETSEAIWMTSGFVYDSAEEADARFAGTSPGFLYGRYANPTVRILEEKLMLLEGAEEALCVGSGMAAVTASVMGVVKAGDRVIAPRALFSSCLWLLENFLPRFGVEVELVDGEDLEQWKKAAQKPVRLALIETPSNPVLGAVDLKAVADILKPTGAIIVVDNVFATPLNQKPLELGAHVVVYSTTKHMDGQGRTLGGAILTSKALMDEHYREYLRHTGPAISPFNAWVILKGLETLHLRVPAQCASAAKIADALAGHPKIARVLYPGRADHPHRAIHAKQMAGGGPLIAFEVKGGQAGAFAFLNNLELIDISNNLGDAKSLATHPATTTHRRLTEEARAQIGVSPGSVRLSVGLEDVDDLIEDVTQALDRI
ncbi:MAG: O-succinylhomoserine sulfhydrylase [Hyphomonadaceae bacterium]|nr:O-succinylhomoserine sulfhydrylase [Hyphomonadaceae bacterium]